MTYTWINYISQVQEKYLHKYHPIIETNDVVVTFFSTYLGNLPLLKDSTSTCDLFVDVIDVFEKHFPDVILMIKPHAITDVDLLEDMLRKKNVKYQITYLHPTVLIQRSSLIIANYVTNLFADSKITGTPVVEYTDQDKDILKFTDGESLSKEYVDRFIGNKDKDELVDAITLYLNQNKITKIFDDYPDSDKLINGMF